MTALTLSIFDQPENASNPNQGATSIKRVQTPWPQQVQLHALVRGHTYEPGVEDTSSDNKAGKEENLDDKTADNDVLAHLHGINASRGHDTTTCALHEE